MMMTDSWFFEVVRSFSGKMAGALATGALFLLAAFSSAQESLPNAVVSLSQNEGQSLSSSLQGTVGCMNGATLALPEVKFASSSESPSIAAFREQAEALAALPAGSQAWLRIAIPSDAFAGDETEKQIADRVDSFLKPAPLTSASLQGVLFEPGAQASNRSVFVLLRLMVAAKSANSALRIGVLLPPGFVAANGDTVKRLALYADLFGVSGMGDWRADAAWIAANALNKPLLLLLGNGGTAEFLNAAQEAAGSMVQSIWLTPSAPESACRIFAMDHFLVQHLPPGVLRADPKALPFALSIDGAPSAGALWYSSGQSGDVAVIAKVGGSAARPAALLLRGTSKSQYELQWFDPESGVLLPYPEPVVKGSEITASCSSSAPFVLMVLHRKSGGATSVFNQVQVKGGVELSVEEIIARLQQAREAQDRRLENYQASSFMTLHFESTTVTQAFDISMNLRKFYQRGQKTDFVQTGFYVNGVKFSSRRDFPLPQLEPEKVLAQPLELTLNDNYTYKLLGTGMVDGAQCYVVGIEPRTPGANLYSGKIWIDGTSFREVRQTLSQRGEHSNVIVNIETQDFALVDDGKGNQFNLPHSISAKQSLNAAGRDFLLQRTMQFSGYLINSPNFNQDIEAAYRSRQPMYRDTDQGLRDLKNENGERVLQKNNTKRIISAVGGAMYTGTFNFPIPFAGVSLADFDFRHTGQQLSVFFAGPILAADLSTQKTPEFRLSADLALSAIPGENRVYQNNVDRTDQDIWSWEQTVGMRATWQATSHLSLTAFTYAAYDIYRRTSETATTFEPPRNGVTIEPGAQIRFTDRGYIFTADGTRGQRIDWRSFGYATSPAQKESAYTLYDGDLNKDYYIGKFTRGGWDMAYYGGVQLDRFSRYFPFYFTSPQLHGIPGGTDTFDAIAMTSAHYGFNVMDLVKFEGLYSYARARNLAESSQFHRFDGAELNFNTGGPKSTLIQGTVGYAINGNIARYNSRWSFILMIFKPF